VTGQNIPGTEVDPKEVRRIIRLALDKASKNILAKKVPAWYDNASVRGEVAASIVEICAKEKIRFFVESKALRESSKFFDKLNRKGIRVIFEQDPGQEDPNQKYFEYGYTT